MDGKGGIMMCKLKGGMDKGGHYGNEKVDAKGWHYDVQIKRDGHYEVEMKGWMEKVAL